MLGISLKAGPRTWPGLRSWISILFVVTLESPRSDFLMRMAGPVAVVLVAVTVRSQFPDRLFILSGFADLFLSILKPRLRRDPKRYHPQHENAYDDRERQVEPASVVVYLTCQQRTA